MTNPLDTMDPRTWRWTAVALAAALVVGGLYAAPTPAGATDDEDPNEPGDRTLDEAVEAWNFSGFSGSIDRTYDGGRWFDVATPIWERYSELKIRVVWTWEFNNRSDDQGRYYMCSYDGTRVEGAYENSSKVCFFFGGDAHYEYDVEVLGERIVNEEVYTCDIPSNCEPGEGTVGILSGGSGGKTGSRPVDVSNRPIHHAVFHAGPVDPVKTRIQVWWNDTYVVVSSGPQEDVYSYRRDDFSSTAFARATAGFDPYVQHGATLKETLIQGDRTTMFEFTQSILWDARTERRGFVRPDGTQESHGPVVGIFPGGLSEVSTQEGEWTFWFDQAAGLTADYPILRGLTFDWAEMPWEE